MSMFGGLSVKQIDLAEQSQTEAPSESKPAPLFAGLQLGQPKREEPAPSSMFAGLSLQKPVEETTA